jgi:hypothetical protein
MKLRNRLIGATLLTAALLSIGEQLWATTCAPDMPMADSEHSAMPGMTDVTAPMSPTDQPEQSPAHDNQRGDCPLDDALVQACGWSMLVALATEVPQGASDHIVADIVQTSLVPRLNHLSSVFHPPRL